MPTINPYDVLGVPMMEASDASIRQRYLALIVQFTPEHHPERFAAIRTAYEKIRTLDDRTRYHLLEADRSESIEALIEDVECSKKRPRPGLDELLASLDETT